MKTIYIVDGNYFDFNSCKPTIGGIQTYISDLLQVCLDCNVRVVLYVNDDECRTVFYNGIEIRGYSFINDKSKWEKVGRKVYTEMEDKNSLVIYYSDEYVPLKTKFPNIIAIQHGIFWDKPIISNRSLVRMLISKGIFTYNLIRRMRQVNNVVCVDYNFVNWYRTQVDRVLNKLIVIPNYSKISSPVEKPVDVVNIVFARRMFWYRGTRVFVDAIEPILNKYAHVHVYIAGTGPDELYMKDKLCNYNNVHFTAFESTESISFHADKHIAVVPTIGSEGTSLSLLEAMSSQCAVICSNVGGMTNIVIDNFNGLIVDAGDATLLSNAIIKLIDNSTLRSELAANAYSTIRTSFSYEDWSLKWKEILLKLI